MTDLVTCFVLPLEQAGIDYFITGSVAAMVYGEPRLTNDIDLVVSVSLGELPKLADCFPAPEFYLPPLESLQCEANRPQRGHFNIIHNESLLKADAYLCGREALHHWAMKNRRRLDIDGHPVAFAPPEYVILRKLQFHQEGGSQKHLSDIAAILAESGSELDRSFLTRQAAQLGILQAWQQAESGEAKS